jgi:hypothetical protein
VSYYGSIAEINELMEEIDMEKQLTIEDLGKFKIVSGIARVTDPCYDTEVWCSGQVEKVMKGDWSSVVVKSDEDEWGVRCAFLIASHYTVPIMPSHDDIDWVEEKFEVGVDSGQAGIFDLTNYRDDDSVAGVKRVHTETLCEDEPFYSICCDRTLSAMSAGVIPFGCVSSSGFGDGGYVCYTITNGNGQVQAIMIDFGLLQEDEEEG